MIKKRKEIGNGCVTIEEALKRFDRRFYSYHVNQDKLSIFSENVKRYVDMTIKAIHEN